MATHHDAEIVLKLYELRREEKMRKARSFVAEKFWPSSADDIVKLVQNFGAEENAYWRQVTSFWEMATSLVHRGAVDADLFFDWSAEAFFIFAKVQPYLEEARKKLDSPAMLANVEKYCNSKPEFKARLEAFIKRTKAMSERFATSAKA